MTRDLENHLARQIRPGDGEPLPVRGPLCSCGCGDSVDEECGECGKWFARGCIERHWREEGEEMENEKPIIRMSQLNAIAACPASWREEQKVRLNISSEASRAGTMEHEIAAAKIRGEKIEPELLATKYGIGVDEIEKVFDRLAFLEERPHWEAHVEERVEYMALAGHVDLYLISPDGKEAEIYDYKTGRLEAPPIERNFQMMGYAMGVWDKHAGLEKITATIVYTRLNERDSVTWDRKAILGDNGVDDTVYQAFTAALKDSPEYRPWSSHCQYCTARASCPALNSAIPMAFTEGEVEAVAKRFSELAPPTRARAIRAAQTVKKMADELLEAAKLCVDAHGPIDMGDGRIFARVEEERDEIDTKAAWPVVSELCGEFLAEVVTLTKTGLRAAALAEYEAAGGDITRGYKSKVERDLFGRLRGAGAMSKKTVAKYQIVNKPTKEIGNGNGNDSSAAA